MTPPATMEEKPKRSYRRREVLASACPECGSKETRVVGYDKDGNGELRSQARYCKCANGHTWKQWPRG